MSPFFGCLASLLHLNRYLASFCRISECLAKQFIQLYLPIRPNTTFSTFRMKHTVLCSLQMFERETKREKILETRHREMRLKERSKSSQDKYVTKCGEGLGCLKALIADYSYYLSLLLLQSDFRTCLIINQWRNIEVFFPIMKNSSVENMKNYICNPIFTTSGILVIEVLSRYQGLNTSENFFPTLSVDRDVK